MNLTSLILSGALLLSLSGCNSTPEGIVNEALPTAATTANSNITSSPTPNASVLPESAPSEPATDPVESTPDAAPEVAAPKAALVEVSSGSFEDRAHKVSGEAKLLEIDGKKILRLENFTTENGPNLFIYLVKNNTGSPQGSDFIDLGSLKSTQGNFNYDVPADTNLKDYQSVSVWCKPFSVNFGTAVLK